MIVFVRMTLCNTSLYLPYLGLWKSYITHDSLCLSALYPSAFRVRRGTPALLNPSFQKSVEDASLLYEVP